MHEVQKCGLLLVSLCQRSSVVCVCVSVYVSVYLSFGHNHELCETGRYAVCGLGSDVQRNHVLGGVQISQRKGQSWGEVRVHS